MNKIKDILKPISKDRLMIFLMILNIILGVAFFVSTILGVQVYDRLIYARYMIFGGEHFYKDVWYSRIFLASLGLIVAFVHNAIIAKIYTVAGRKMALFFTAITILLVIISSLMVAAIVREIPN